MSDYNVYNVSLTIFKPHNTDSGDESRSHSDSRNHAATIKDSPSATDPPTAERGHIFLSQTDSPSNKSPLLPRATGGNNSAI